MPGNGKPKEKPAAAGTAGRLDIIENHVVINSLTERLGQAESVSGGATVAAADELHEAPGRLAKRLSPAASRMLEGGISFAAIERNLSNPERTLGRCLVQDLVPATGVCGWYGPSGTYKTALAVKCAVDIAAGGRAVAYFAAEDYPGVQARALGAIKAAGLDNETPLRIFPFEGFVHAPEFKQDIYEVARAYALEAQRPFGAVFLDTYGAAFGGMSQDDAAPATMAMQNLERAALQLGGPFVFIHHSGKDRSRGMMGSQVIRNRADVVISFARVLGSPAVIKTKVEKFRNGPEGALAEVRFEPYAFDCAGVAQSVMTVREIDRTAKRKDGNRAEQKPAAGHGEMIRIKGDNRRGFDILVRIIADADNVAQEDWRDAVYQDDGFSNRQQPAKRKAFHLMRKALIDAGFVSIDGDRVSVTKREQA